MFRNNDTADQSIHHVSGNVITGSFVGTVTSNVNTFSVLREQDWVTLHAEYNEAIAKLEGEKARRMYKELGEAIAEKNESKLQKAAKAIGKFGIDLLTASTKSVLSRVLLEAIGMT